MILIILILSAFILWEKVKIKNSQNVQQSEVKNDGVLASALDSINTAIRNKDETLRILNNTVSEIREVMVNTYTRGKWGEIVLENLLENYGLPKDIYKIQERKYINNEYLTPDASIKLPNDKYVYIDSKFPLEGLDKGNIAGMVRGFVKQVSKYNGLEDSIGISILFIPAEGIYNRICAELDNDLLKYLKNHGVILASAITLQYFLYVIMSLWQYYTISSKTDKFIGIIDNFMSDLEAVDSKLESDVIAKLKALYGAILDHRKEINKLKLKFTELSYKQ